MDDQERREERKDRIWNIGGLIVSLIILGLMMSLFHGDGSVTAPEECGGYITRYEC